MSCQRSVHMAMDDMSCQRGVHMENYIICSHGHCM